MRTDCKADDGWNETRAILAAFVTLPRVDRLLAPGDCDKRRRVARPSPAQSIGQQRCLIVVIADVGCGRRRSLARQNGNAPRFTEARASHGTARQARLATAAGS